MAVYTQVSRQELAALLDGYEIGTALEFKGIAAGVENSNFFLRTDKGRYILTLYEKRVRRQDLPFFLSYMEHLAAQKIPCPMPVHDKNGKVLNEVNGKAAAIISFLEGKSTRRITAHHCHEVGKWLAKMHLAVEGFTMQRENTMSMTVCKQLFDDVRQQAHLVNPYLADEAKQAFDIVRCHWPKHLPEGIIHADLFPDNVFFKEGKLSGMIDFYFACSDFFAYDIAIVMNAWCFEKDIAFNITKATEFFAGYNAVRPLSTKELDHLPVLALGASLRFLSSRLYDWLHRVENALVTPHNPLEYLEKMRFHQKVKSYTEYGI